MPVVCGRAGRGAGSVLRATICGTFAVLSLVSGGCGNSTITYGTAVMTLSNTAGPFTSYFVNIVAMTLTRTDGTVVEPLRAEERVNLAQYDDISELIGSPAVPEGTYTSATISIDYTAALITFAVNGQSQPATVVDGKGDPVSTFTYTVTFDPAHPLVLTNSNSSRLELNIDLSASNIVNAATSPIKVAVNPFIAISTIPVDRKPIQARGLFVTVDTASNTFTFNSRPFIDEVSALGALTVQTNAQTTYNVNGKSYLGAAGLAVLKALPINTTVLAVGSMGSLSTITPGFNATAVYAGASEDDLLLTRVTGTVSARTATTLTLHGATVFQPNGSIAYTFINDLPVTVAASTIVNEDGAPDATGLSEKSISVGQQIKAGGAPTVNSSAQITLLDTTAGEIRLAPTPAWGTLNAGATVGTASLNLLSLGGYVPAAFHFAGTGSASGLDANPATYAVNTGSIDESGTSAGTLVRFDGFVSPFGTAPPDFNAIAATPGADVDQVLVVDWVSGGATAPFLSTNSSGLVVNITNTHLGSEHLIRYGPAFVDLTSPVHINPVIVPDPTLTNQLAIGNATNGISMFNSFASFVTKIGSTLNGTNALQKLVAVGHFDAATGTFTAYRIDLVQQ